jgi:hypothetical protein
LNINPWISIEIMWYHNSKQQTFLIDRWLLVATASDLVFFGSKIELLRFLVNVHYCFFYELFHTSIMHFQMEFNRNSSVHT